MRVKHHKKTGMKGKKWRKIGRGEQSLIDAPETY